MNMPTWFALDRNRLTVLLAGALLVAVVLGRSRLADQSAPPRAAENSANDSAIPTFPAAIAFAVGPSEGQPGRIQLCQSCGVAGGMCNRDIQGIDCSHGNGCGEQQWDNWGPIPWQAFNQGEYVGPARSVHIEEYRFRPDDEIEFMYRQTRVQQGVAYRLQVGDTMRLESLVDPTLDRDLIVQPDGNITVRLLGQIRAANRTISELEEDLEERYKTFVRIPDLKSDLTVTPKELNTRLTDLLATVNNRFNQGGIGKRVVVTPEGTVALPGIGSFCVQGLTITELKVEVNERYSRIVGGVEIEPILTKRAPRYVFVAGEVRNPNRYTLEGPTTLMQSIALAGGWINGGNMREIVVFRRAEDWRLLATRIDIRGAMIGKNPNPSDEIWLRDSDIVVVPKGNVRRANEILDLVFTQGIYRAIPLSFSIQPGQL